MKTLICSDDRLIELDVRKGDHVIHYELPDDFDTFSLRHSTVRDNLSQELFNQVIVILT